MARFTQKADKNLEIIGIKYAPIDTDHLIELLNKLGEFEDLEELGLLLKLPCKIDDPVFATSYYYDCDFSEKCPEFHKCEEDMHCKYQYKKYFVRETKFKIEMLPLLGKTIFPTEEAAKASLRVPQEGK